MPVTVSHALSATTPNNTSYEIRPEHWNSNHIATISAVGSEISGAFSNANGFSFGLDGAQITGSYTVPSSFVNALNGSSGAISINAGSSLSASTNGSSITLGLATNITTALQSAGAYLTTAAQSNHSHGNPTLALTNISGTTASNSAGLTLSLSVGAGGAGDGVNILAAGTRTATTAGTVVLSDSNGITFGLNGVNGSIITASHNGITTGALSNHSHGFSAPGGSSAFQTLNFANSFGVSWTNSAGSVMASVNTTYAASNHSHGNPTLALTNISGTTASASNGLTLSLSVDATTSISATGAVSLSANGSTLSIGVPQFSFYASSNTTAQSSSSSFSHGSLSFRGVGGVSVGFSAGEVVISGGAGAAPAASAANGSFTYNTMSFSNVNGISFGTSAGSAITASHNAITTGRASTDAIGLNTANTNVTWTVNSSGLSLNAAGYAGTATGFTGVGAISATLTHNTVGLSLNVSVPATSSILGFRGITVSSAGSTISVGQVLASYWDNMEGIWPNSTTMQVAQSTSHIMPFILPEPISFAFMRMPMTASLIGASTTAATTGNSQFSYGHSRSHNYVIYSRGIGASSQSLMSVASTQLTDRQSINVSANANSTQFSYTNRATYAMSTGPVGFTFDYSSSAASLNFHTSGMTGITGLKMMELNWASSLTPGQYWLAYGMSSSTVSQYTAPGTQLFNVFTNFGMSQPNLAFGTIGSATAANIGPYFGLGSFSTAGGGTTANLPISAISTSGSHNLMMFQLGNIA